MCIRDRSFSASVSSGSTAGVKASGGSDVYAVTLTGEDSLATNGVKTTPKISSTIPLTVSLLEDKKDNIDYFSVLQDFVSALSSNDRGQIGRAVSEPPPLSSLIFSSLSSNLLCK